jgi:hypothetical protein
MSLIFYMSVWLANVCVASSFGYVTGQLLCVLARACPRRRTVVQLPVQTRPTKPSILSELVKLVAVCIQWVNAIEDCVSPVPRDDKCVCMAL